jgi:hypothetical protein
VVAVRRSLRLASSRVASSGDAWPEPRLGNLCQRRVARSEASVSLLPKDERGGPRWPVSPACGRRPDGGRGRRLTARRGEPRAPVTAVASTSQPHIRAGRPRQGAPHTAGGPGAAAVSKREITDSLLRATSPTRPVITGFTITIPVWYRLHHNDQASLSYRPRSRADVACRAAAWAPARPGGA